MKEQPTDSLAEALKQALSIQDQLKQKFDIAHQADEYKDEINISNELKTSITIKMDRNNFYILHIPSGIYMACSANTMPRALKRTIEEWVSSITQPTDSSTS